MKTTKRLLAFVLCFAMLVGMLPMYALHADAAETVLDAAIFCSDVHGSTSDLTSVMSGVKTSGVDYSAIGFVGDTCLTVANTTSTVQSALGDTDIAVMFSYASSHDTEDGADIDENWDYSGEVEGVSDYYLVYTIRETDMQYSSNANTASAAFTTWYSGLTDAQKKLPIFVMSHRPIHARRGGNQGGEVWTKAFNAAGATSDIVVFWAHNHTGETSVDTGYYYAAKGSTVNVATSSGSSSSANESGTGTDYEIQFTYMNAGYINANGQNPARLGVATTVQITADSLIFQDYSSSGEYTDSTYSHNVTVTRQFASSSESTTKTLSSIAVTTAPTTTVYNVGDTFSSEGLVVTATYSDGTTAAVTGYTLSEVDMTTAGTKTVTVTYTEGDVTQTATFDITVNAVVAEDAVLSSITVSGKNEYSQGEALDLTVTAIFEDGTSKTLSSGEYTVTGYDANTTGEQTVTVTYSYGDVTKTAEYTVTVVEADSNEVTLGSDTATTQKVYVLTDTMTSGENYLIVDSNSTSGNALINSSNSVGSTTVTINSGSLTIDGTTANETYIVLDNSNAVWTAGTSGSNGAFKNNGYYLYHKNSNLSLVTSTNNTNWTWDGTNNYLYYSGGGTKYLVYSDGWDISETADNVYLYQEVEATVTTSTKVIYTMRAENLTKVVTAADETAVLDYCLQGNGADLTTLPEGGSYSFTVLSDESGIISGDIASDGSFTFSDTTGKAKVKVAYTWTADDGNTYTVYKNITVEATEPYYTIDLHKQTTDDSGNPAAGDEITSTIAIKGVAAGDTYSVWAVVKYHDGTTEGGVDQGDVEDNLIEWTSSDTSIATVDPATGVITFTGKDGTVNITATYLDGNKPSDTITISATASQYSVPSDGTNDFPEYPNEGAIRYDKTATAVGNFSETGIAQVELSMTGVPYTTGSELDVVLMLDITGSMHDVTISSYTYSQYARVEYTILASQAFVESIVVNEDGSYNGNRVGVYSFNSNGTFTLFDLGTISSDAELTAAKAAIATLNDDYASGGTPYDDGLSKVQSVLSAAKTDGTGNNRQQFAIFMTDGVPTDYEYITGSTHANYSSASDIAGMLTSSDNYCTRDTDYYYEYYSTAMKTAGVTVYSVGIGLENKNSAWSSGDATDCLNLASRLLNDISGPANETTQPDAVGTSTLSKKDSYFFSVDDADAATEMENVFSNIAMKILQAATDITVEDQITDEYTMIFDIPTDTNYDHTISTSQEFYIEFLKYTLDDNHERVDTDSDGDTYDDATSVTKLYLIDSNGTTAGGTYSAGSSATTAYDAPVFAQTTIGDKGTLYYWTIDETYASKAAVTYTNSDDTYYFIPYGMEENVDGTAPTGWYNMTSGAYAYGTIDEVTNTSTDLVIATPYFVYNASTKMLYWAVDKLDTAEYTLRYFLYLDDSATDVGETTEVPAATYPTNDHAYITYTNFRGNDCQQKFPIPQLTWNGAQVSYVFYLVNSAGQPINKSGQVVDFANAVFVTDVYTKAVVWNKSGDTTTGTGDLSADWLANDLLPDEYTIYDEQARFTLNVYEKADGTTIKNQFTIAGGTAAEISDSLNSRLDLETTASTVSVATTKVYNTKAGLKVTGYGKYDSATLTGIDFSNTTVAFAVVWESKLVEDVVVVDYGLDVLINVVQNDLLQNTVSGIGVGNSAYGSIEMNTGVIATSQLGTASLTIDGNTISIENENAVRFHQGDMEFKNPVKFYYESPVKFYEDSEAKTGYMYSSVTVIPATTIYYEDEYVDLKTYEVLKNEDGTIQTDTYGNPVFDSVGTNGWDTNSVAASATQQQDRPGTSQIAAALDADNNYGYDAAYASMSSHSMNNAAMINVNAYKKGEATFTFYGTGFDIISVTSNMTGTLMVQVAGTVAATGATYRKNLMVDTYYGYTQNADGEWVTEINNPNALYQVPVIKLGGLEFGQYTVKLVAAYSDAFAHNSADNYDLYLDAIRIYDPTGNQNADANAAYVKDGEGWPIYKELRNLVITANTFGSYLTVDSTDYSDVTVNGAVFIDSDDTSSSIDDYTSYGPNNELYLAPGQAVAFEIADAFVNSSNTKINPVKVQLAIKTVGTSDAKVEIFNPSISTSTTTEGTTQTTTKTFVKGDLIAKTISTATDMYYDITDLTDDVIVISNPGEEGIVSITNIKFTFGEAASLKIVTTTNEDGTEETSEASVASISEEGAVYSLRSLRAYSVSETVETETEPTEPETEATEPETEATEPETETTEPETEATEPETEATEPETEATEPETEATEPEDDESDNSGLVGLIKKLLGWLFG